MKTIDYYNNNSQAFYDRTINADITDSYKKFLKYLPEKAKILFDERGAAPIKYRTSLVDYYLNFAIDYSFLSHLLPD